MKLLLTNKLYIFLGTIGILDTAILIPFTNAINVGILFPGVAGLLLAFIGINREYKIFNITIRNRRIKAILKFLIIVWIISFVIIESLIVFSLKSEENAKVDYLMILGAGLRGKEPSLTLLERLDKGVDYLHINQDVRVIVSGGKGLGEEITEAEAMKNYLIEQGIKEDRIIKEETSTSTMENFKNTKEILNKDNNETVKILIVTNDFHIFRSKILAERNGFEAYGMPSKTPWSILPNSYIREYFAVVKSLVFDR
jgi:uncharacterized SAM-binding protein YcdF (DUF218 family)